MSDTDIEDYVIITASHPNLSMITYAIWLVHRFKMKEIKNVTKIREILMANEIDAEIMINEFYYRWNIRPKINYESIVKQLCNFSQRVN